MINPDVTLVCFITFMIIIILFLLQSLVYLFFITTCVFGVYRHFQHLFHAASYTLLLHHRLIGGKRGREIPSHEETIGKTLVFGRRPGTSTPLEVVIRIWTLTSVLKICCQNSKTQPLDHRCHLLRLRIILYFSSKKELPVKNEK